LVGCFWAAVGERCEQLEWKRWEARQESAECLLGVALVRCVGAAAGECREQ
jgi:hypothetical protein